MWGIVNLLTNILKRIRKYPMHDQRNHQPAIYRLPPEKKIARLEKFCRYFAVKS